MSCKLCKRHAQNEFPPSCVDARRAAAEGRPRQSGESGTDYCIKLAEISKHYCAQFLATKPRRKEVN